MRIELNDSQAKRFWGKVNKHSGKFYIDPVSGSMSECWEWESTKNEKGYGRFGMNRKQVFAHRISYVLHNKEQLGEYHSLHKCDNPPCVNPDHLFKGTNLENMVDRDKKCRRIPARGDRHWTRKHPELVARGERAGPVKLNTRKVLRIRKLYNEHVPHQVIADKFDIGTSQVNRIGRKISWSWLDDN